MKLEIQPYMRERAEREKAQTGRYPQWWLDMQGSGTRSKQKASAGAGTCSRARLPRRRKPPADYEGQLLQQMRLAGMPEPQTQHRWHPTRLFRADFAYPELHILIEVQGGIYLQDRGTGEGGGHNRGKAYENDRAKYAEAQLIGWMVLEFGPNHVTSGEALAMIERALQTRSVSAPGKEDK